MLGQPQSEDAPLPGVSEAIGWLCGTIGWNLVVPVFKSTIHLNKDALGVEGGSGCATPKYPPMRDVHSQIGLTELFPSHAINAERR